MTGTFKLTYKGNAVELNADSDAYTMKNKLMEMGLSVLTSVNLRGHNIMTRSYIIDFNDQKGD